MVTLSCGKLNGTFSRDIFVSTNDPNHPKETLVCKGRILEALKITPKYIHFGRASPEAPTQKTVSITRGDGGPLSPKLAPINTQGLEAKINEIKPGEHYELVATLTPPFTSTRIQATLQLETGVPQSPIATIPVHAAFGPPGKAKPPSRSTP